jgi:transposase
MANILNLNAAGIDIGSKEHYVAVPEDRAKESVRCFKSFTQDLHELVKWLKECKIDTIAMESTGVYWYHLYTILLDYDFEVYLVNAYHVRNVPGRKSDVSDARWLQQLHSFGLLNGCFQPDNLTRSLRNYVRLRRKIIQQMGKETQRMQKALEMMNIKLNHVIRDLNGQTGTMIIESILSGERNEDVLAKLKDPRVKVSHEILTKSLQGNWREEEIFNLQIAYEHYNFLKKQLKKCDTRSNSILKKISGPDSKIKNLAKTRKQKNSPEFDVRKYLYECLGVDVTEIYGMKEVVALRVFSETGPNLKEKFPTEKQFLSWLNVVPDNKITGGKVISSRVRKKKNNAGQAFRDAANTLWKAQNPIGDYLRRKKAKSGGRQEIVATARKLASVYYKLVTEKVQFDPQVLEEKSQGYLENKLKYLEKMTLRVKLELTNNQQLKECVIS